MTFVDRTARDANYHTVTAACDICGRKCPGTTQYGTGDWESETAHLRALDAGWVAKLFGRLRVLLCKRCQKLTDDEQTEKWAARRSA